MTTSVVVVSYRPHRWLERCLLSVVDQADEVILVDNGSPEGAVGTVGRHIGVRVKHLPTNRGFAGGVNAGLAAARGDILALLNDDAFADPGWLASAARVLADPAVAAVGPKIVFPDPFIEIRFDETPRFVPPDPRPLGRCVERAAVDGVDVPLDVLLGPGLHELERLQQEGRTVRRWRWAAGAGPIFLPIPEGTKGSTVTVNDEPIPIRGMVEVVSNAGSYLSARGHGGDYGFGALHDDAFDQPAERFATTGAAMAVRAETFGAIGPFAESFFAYYEDFDWCWRAQLHGLTIRYEPSGVVRHVGGASSGGPLHDRVRYLGARNRIHALARNAPLKVLLPEVRSPADRPESLHRRSLAKRVVCGLLERQTLRRGWRRSPDEVWRTWAGRNENW